LLCLSPDACEPTPLATGGDIRRIGTIRAGAGLTEHVSEDGLSIETIEGGIRVIGLIDLSTVDRFRQAAAATAVRGSDLTADLAGCTFIGSEGIGVLIDALKAVGAGQLILRSPPGIVRKVLDLAGLAKLPNVQIGTG
jgi:anti-anti-sigma factor